MMRAAAKLLGSLFFGIVALAIVLDLAAIVWNRRYGGTYLELW